MLGEGVRGQAGLFVKVNGNVKGVRQGRGARGGSYGFSGLGVSHGGNRRADKHSPLLKATQLNPYPTKLGSEVIVPKPHRKHLSINGFCGVRGNVNCCFTTRYRPVF